MTKRLAGQVALVTGGARGIGAATAARLTEEGAIVSICDVDGRSAEEAVRALSETGPSGAAFGVDVRDRTEVEAMIADVVAQFGKLNLLVNNAGITRDNLIYKMSDSDWDDVIEVHLKGAFLCSRAAQRQMVEQRQGKIVNVSSSSAAGNRGQSNYSAAKAGLLGLTRTLAIELGPFGINVNAVAPGFIDTDMTRATARRLGYEPEEYMALRADAVPLKRVGKPRDIANAICFLCTDEASFITGQTIAVRGGPGPFG